MYGTRPNRKLQCAYTFLSKIFHEKIKITNRAAILHFSPAVPFNVENFLIYAFASMATRNTIVLTKFCLFFDFVAINCCRLKDKRVRDFVCNSCPDSF